MHYHCGEYSCPFFNREREKKSPSFMAFWQCPLCQKRLFSSIPSCATVFSVVHPTSKTQNLLSVAPSDTQNMVSLMINPTSET